MILANCGSINVSKCGDLSNIDVEVASVLGNLDNCGSAKSRTLVDVSELIEVKVIEELLGILGPLAAVEIVSDGISIKAELGSDIINGIIQIINNPII